MVEVSWQLSICNHTHLFLVFLPSMSKFYLINCLVVFISTCVATRALDYSSLIKFPSGHVSRPLPVLVNLSVWGKWHYLDLIPGPLHWALPVYPSRAAEWSGCDLTLLTEKINEKAAFLSPQILASQWSCPVCPVGSTLRPCHRRRWWFVCPRGDSTPRPLLQPPIPWVLILRGAPRPRSCPTTTPPFYRRSSPASPTKLTATLYSSNMAACTRPAALLRSSTKPWHSPCRGSKGQ